MNKEEERKAVLRAKNRRASRLNYSKNKDEILAAQREKYHLNQQLKKEEAAKLKQDTIKAPRQYKQKEWKVDTTMSQFAQAEMQKILDRRAMMGKVEITDRHFQILEEALTNRFDTSGSVLKGYVQEHQMRESK